MTARPSSDSGHRTVPPARSDAPQTAPSEGASGSRIVASEAFFVTDERQRIRAWSEAAERLLGYAAADAEGRLCYEVIMGRRAEGHPVCGTTCPVTRNARRGRGTAAYEVLATAADGTTRFLASSVVVIEEKRGRFRVVHLVHEAEAQRSPRPVSNPPAAAGESPPAERLTRRELEVLRLVAGGSTLEEVAGRLAISEFTARNHVTNVEHKLGVRNRVQMVLEGMRRGLV